MTGVCLQVQDELKKTTDKISALTKTAAEATAAKEAAEKATKGSSAAVKEAVEKERAAATAAVTAAEKVCGRTTPSTLTGRSTVVCTERHTCTCLKVVAVVDASGLP